MMKLGLGLLALSPGAFWAMTPKELAAAIAAISDEHTNQPIERADFDSLLQRFPDTLKE